MIATIFACTSPALTIAQAVPQVVRVRRAGSHGVSSGSWLLTLVFAEWWVAYGSLASVPAEVVTNGVNCWLAWLILWSMRRSHARADSSLLAAAGLTVLTAVGVMISVLTHAQSIVPAIAVTGTLSLYLPQMIKVFREVDRSGVSLPSWVLALLAAVSWGAYGLLIHKLPVWLPTVLLGPTSLLIVGRLGIDRWSRTRVKPHATPVAPGSAPAPAEASIGAPASAQAGATQPAGCDARC